MTERVNPEEMRREPVVKRLFHKPLRAALSTHEFILAGVATLLLTAAVWLIEPVTGYQSIALLYLLLVVALSLRVSRGPVLAAAAISCGVVELSLHRAALHFQN
jgi:K+-sensing histidine kinase KdpD